MNTTARSLLMQRWHVLQQDLLPALGHELGSLSPKLEQLIRVLEWTRIEAFLCSKRGGVGRPPHERAWLVNAFVAKSVLGISTTVGLRERLSMDRALRRICGFSMYKVLPSAATFSRAFAEFAQDRLVERVHEALIQTMLGEQLIGHISRDSTAIEARERRSASPAPVKGVKRRGRPRQGEVREPVLSPIARQRTQTLAQMLAEIPTHCDRGVKRNAKGHSVSWTGYKLHLDTADCGVPIAALLSSASVHDSRVAIPLSRLSASRVTHLYDVMDAAYCSLDIHEHCRHLGHIPLIDHNPRGGQKIEFEPPDAVRYRERTVAERMNARLKDEFGARNIRVRGPLKVACHLMFGVLALSADQLMRLLL